jgi:hypothetical protein
MFCYDASDFLPHTCGTKLLVREFAYYLHTNSCFRIAISLRILFVGPVTGLQPYHARTASSSAPLDSSRCTIFSRYCTLLPAASCSTTHSIAHSFRIGMRVCPLDAVLRDLPTAIGFIHLQTERKPRSEHQEGGNRFLGLTRLGLFREQAPGGPAKKRKPFLHASACITLLLLVPIPLIPLLPHKQSQQRRNRKRVGVKLVWSQQPCTSAKGMRQRCTLILLVLAVCTACAAAAG